MSRYEILHYPDDVRDGTSTGAILGHDEVGRPYAVLDTDLDVCECSNPFGDEECPSCLGTGLQTTVHLAYAATEQITAAVAEQQAQMEDNTERYLRLRAAGLVR